MNIDIHRMVYPVKGICCITQNTIIFKQIKNVAYPR